MTKTFLFYDLETTGLNKAFDQVQQFAAIRTDLELNEIERHEIFLRISSDVIPSPEALLVHRVDLNLCNSIGLCEYEGVKAIHHLLNTPNTISIGYNSLGFDDEFLRFSFYRNLLSPYTHQYANGCGRADLFPITALFRWQDSECLTWPTIEGKPTLKLECINEENQLAQGQAHNALVDVEATIALAKKLKKQESQWQYALNFFDKHHETKRLSQLTPPTSHPSLPVLALLVDGGFGPRNQYQMPALLLGHHRHYRNQTLWLKLDGEAFDSATFLSDARIIRKKSGESPLFFPYHRRFSDKLNEERRQQVNQSLTWLADHPDDLTQLIHQSLEDCYPEIENLPLEANLYQTSFPDSKTSQALFQFHNSSHPMTLVKQLPPPYRELGLRLMARNYPEQCDSATLRNYQQHCQSVYQGQINHQNKRSRSLDEVIDAYGQLDTGSWDHEQQNLMRTLKHHLEQRKTLCEAT